MFCTKCGAQLNEGQRFCTKCGAPVADLQQQPTVANREQPPTKFESQQAPATYSPQQAPTVFDPRQAPVAPGPQQAQAAAQPQKRLPVNPVIIACAAIAVVAAIAFIVFFILTTPSKNIAAEEPTEISQITRIYPVNESGKQLDDYAVKLVDKKSGKEISSINVKNRDGFTMADLASQAKEKDLSAGQYVIVVVDKKTDKQSSSAVNYDKNNAKAAESVQVGNEGKQSQGDKQQNSQQAGAQNGEQQNSQQSGAQASEQDGGSQTADSGSSSATEPVSSSESSQKSSSATGEAASSDSAKEMYAGYLEAAENLIAKHQQGKVATLEKEQLLQMEGAFLADLVDLDKNGTDELILAYYDKEEASKRTDSLSGNMNDPRSYHVEIWAFDGSKAARVYEHEADSTNGAFAFFRLWENDGYITAPVTYETVGKRTDVITTLYRLKDAKMKPFKTFTCKNAYATDSAGPTYEVDGAEKSKQDYDKAYEGVINKNTPCIVYWFTQSSSGTTSEQHAKGSKSYKPADLAGLTERTLAACKAGAEGGADAAKGAEASTGSQASQEKSADESKS